MDGGERHVGELVDEVPGAVGRGLQAIRSESPKALAINGWSQTPESRTNGITWCVSRPRR